MESRRKVLVVDDEELNQDLLRFFLSEKFDVYTAGIVGTFYRLIERIDFDLIIMDVSLRDSKDGLQLTRELKSNDRYKHIPVFVLTAFSSTKERQGAYNAGADQFLTKPTNKATLVRLVGSVLNNKSMSATDSKRN